MTQAGAHTLPLFFNLTKYFKMLHIDIETYSSEPLRSAGVYRYAEALDFEILIIAYSWGDDPVEVIDIASGEKIPQELLAALSNNTPKCAHNANFERVCFKNIGIDSPISSWICSAVKATYCGLPRDLAGLSKILDLGEAAKDTAGTSLINYFSKPCKPTKANGQRHRNLPSHDPEKWATYKDYCRQDVFAEREVLMRLEYHTITATEREHYLLDQKINDRGVRVDLDFAQAAYSLDTLHKAEVLVDMRGRTGIDNPNSDDQFKGWLFDEFGMAVESLLAELVPGIIAEAQSVDSSGRAAQALELRKDLKKTSVKKYTAMLACTCIDGRARGLFQFYGARTGRWAGRLIQLQNLPKNKREDLAEARELVKYSSFNEIVRTEDNIPGMLSELIRTALIPGRGKVFIVADFSAIEARVIAWLAEETWRLRVFNTHGKIYEASAANMFGVPIEAVTKTSDYRAKGKIAELALGYQGGSGALARMGGEAMGLSEADMVTIVKKWRRANPAIVRLWATVQKAATRAFETRKPCRIRGLVFNYDGEVLTIELPSKRKIFYQSPGFRPNRFGGESMYYYGTDSTTKQWCKIDTYGGKFVENIVQAIARDLLAEANLRLDAKGFDIVMHVHDETICETLPGDEFFTLERMCEIMSETPKWAAGLPLAADGYITEFYKKD